MSNTQSIRDLRTEWDVFVNRLAGAVHSARHPEDTSPEALAVCAFQLTAPVTRLLARALFIRLEKAAAEGIAPQTWLQRHATLPSRALSMLEAACADSNDPRVRVFLDGLASGRVRSRSDVTGVAEEVGMSAPYFHRLVNSQTHVLVQQHIDVWRLLAAARLLSRTFLSVKEIAALVGYEHTPSLDRRFRSVLGVRPTEFRDYGSRAAPPARTVAPVATFSVPVGSATDLQRRLIEETSHVGHKMGGFAFIELGSSREIWTHGATGPLLTPRGRKEGRPFPFTRFPALATARTEVLSSGRDRQVEVTLEGDGRRRRFCIALTPLLNPEGAVVGLYGLGSELTPAS